MAQAYAALALLALLAAVTGAPQSYDNGRAANRGRQTDNGAPDAQQMPMNVSLPCTLQIDKSITCWTERK